MHLAISHFPEIVDVATVAVIDLERQSLARVHVGEDTITTARSGVYVKDSFVVRLDGVVPAIWTRGISALLGLSRCLTRRGCDDDWRLGSVS